MKETLLNRTFLSLLLLFLPLTLLAQSEGLRDLPASPSSSVYVVKKGDCLWNISKKLYKDPFKWPLLYQHNKSLIQNPDQIEVGMKLTVPLTMGAAEVKEAIQFAYNYKEPARKSQTHLAIAHKPKHKNSATTSSREPSSSEKSGQAAQASAPTKPEQPVSSQKPEESQPSASAQPAEKNQASGSMTPVIAILVLILLAGGGILWWKFGQTGKKTEQEPYRVAQTPSTRPKEWTFTPSSVAPPIEAPKAVPVEKPAPVVPTPQATSQPVSPVVAPPQQAPETPKEGVSPAPLAGGIPTPTQPVLPREEKVESSPLVSPQVSAPVNPPTTLESSEQAPPTPDKPKDENHRDVA